jgi:MFS family permease
LLVTRGFQAFSLSSFGTVGSGTIIDIYPPEQRGWPLGIYSSVGSCDIAFLVYLTTECR